MPKKRAINHQKYCPARDNISVENVYEAGKPVSLVVPSGKQGMVLFHIQKHNCRGLFFICKINRSTTKRDRFLEEYRALLDKHDIDYDERHIFFCS